MDTAVFTSMYD